MTQTPEGPRAAATVIVARPGAASAGFEIFMVRRSAKSPFMPSTLVFPGGRLDPEDGDPTADAAWERAARRECLEEAGLRGLGALLWFDTWLTPSAESTHRPGGARTRRYLTRFFLARLQPGEGEEAQADGHETHAGRWATVDAHLMAWDRMEVDLPPPTLCTLLRLRPLGFDALASLAEHDPADTILPKVTLGARGPIIVMPHDSTYPNVPGEALPAPARVHDLPRRFVRDDRVWRPSEEGDG
jgi:8-oxo-dGTP pyrophosphatase MutT (NUDIX family)